MTIETGADTAQVSRASSTHVVVALGNPVTAAAVSRLGEVLASFGANINVIRGIAQYPVTGLEFRITIPDYTPGDGKEIRRQLAELSAELGIDIAMEHAGLHRRAKRLVCFDCDSTLITGEVIEMLAAHAGKEAEVAEVTDLSLIHI
mgnify:FL=1